MDNIYNIAIECKTFADRQININKNKIVSSISNTHQIVYTDYDIRGNIKYYETQLLALFNAIKIKYPAISLLLKEHIELYDNDKIIHYSAIKSIVECIIILEEKVQGSKKIFISHSSKDKNLIRKFVDNILQLGIGIKSEDIFCTSIEDMAIRNGEDIHRHIQNNIRNADYSFLLISKNYKASEICINEMGAVWAYDSNVRLFLLPNVDFSEIGWLCNTRTAEYINNAIALDALHKEMVEYYNITDDTITWSRQRETFINDIKTL